MIREWDSLMDNFSSSTHSIYTYVMPAYIVAICAYHGEHCGALQGIITLYKFITFLHV